ncbi:MAG: hypothetical protein GYB53_17905 [Rhodobacteraceae bacterium]|nr:hypothetical protein [Paracoccaceae bacterium]MBR9821923.1 hypothetical protein [Paracoccaceae bacterium]
MTLKTYVDLAPRTGGEAWKLAFTTNAMCAYEEETGKDFTAVAESLNGAKEGRVSMRVTRTLLWAGLQEYQEGTTLRDAGKVLDACGMAPAFQAIGSAIRLAFPEAKEASGNGGKAGKAAPARAKEPTGPS